MPALQFQNVLYLIWSTKPSKNHSNRHSDFSLVFHRLSFVWRLITRVGSVNFGVIHFLKKTVPHLLADVYVMFLFSLNYLPLISRNSRYGLGLSFDLNGSSGLVKFNLNGSSRLVNSIWGIFNIDHQSNHAPGEFWLQFDVGLLTFFLWTWK